MASPSAMCSLCLRAAQRAPRTVSKGVNQPSNLSRRTYNTATAPARRTAKPSSITQIARRPAPSLTYAPRRCLATATSPTAPPSDPQPARAILHPRKDASGTEMRVSFSPRAAQRLASIASADNNPNLALRISIESGGCHGFQYLMELSDLSKTPATEEDTVFEGDKGAKTVIDEASLELLNGSTVDYTMELIGSQFKITGIPGATSSCGCGSSFDIKF
ncbi:hypothetical protein P280DRAFT_466086 [Massarina eburnea CBS 473.64]|uniref:Core domain-containing protein n=1 Tax=Massarina eburnea CBS 473.64 TaxID=1395130 RepID=A0A6A6SD79_9PLEO|nr:hypothetical protein P280DRAFT_466086 [Massarina eburnea CBS 473.64]